MRTLVDDVSLTVTISSCLSRPRVTHLFSRSTSSTTRSYMKTLSMEHTPTPTYTLNGSLAFLDHTGHGSMVHFKVSRQRGHAGWHRAAQSLNNPMARPVEYSAVLLLPFTPYESLLCISNRLMYLVCACTWRTVFYIISPPLSPLQVITSRCPGPGDKRWLRSIGIGKLCCSTFRLQGLWPIYTATWLSLRI